MMILTASRLIVASTTAFTVITREARLLFSLIRFLLISQVNGTAKPILMLYCNRRSTFPFCNAFSRHYVFSFLDAP